MSRLLQVLLVLLVLAGLAAVLLRPLPDLGANSPLPSPTTLVRLRQAVARERSLAERLPALRRAVRRLAPALRDLPADKGSETVGLLRELSRAARATGITVVQASFGAQRSVGPLHTVKATIEVQGSLAAQAAMLRALEGGRPPVAVLQWDGTGSGGEVVLKWFYR